MQHGDTMLCKREYTLAVMQCAAQVRNDDPYIGKYGMTEIELNKVPAQL